MNINPTVTSALPAKKNFMVAALTDPQYVPVTKVWVNYDERFAPILPGTIVAEITTGINAGKVGIYIPNHPTRGVPIGVLHSGISRSDLVVADANGNETPNDAPATVFVGGAFKASELPGFDQNVVTALHGVHDDSDIFRF